MEPSLRRASGWHLGLGDLGPQGFGTHRQCRGFEVLAISRLRFGGLGVCSVDTLCAEHRVVGVLWDLPQKFDLTVHAFVHWVCPEYSPLLQARSNLPHPGTPQWKLQSCLFDPCRSFGFRVCIATTAYGFQAFETKNRAFAKNRGNHKFQSEGLPISAPCARQYFG